MISSIATLKDTLTAKNSSISPHLNSLFTSLSETRSIPDLFTWELPSPEYYLHNSHFQLHVSWGFLCFVLMVLCL